MSDMMRREDVQNDPPQRERERERKRERERLIYVSKIQRILKKEKK